MKLKSGLTYRRIDVYTFGTGEILAHSLPWQGGGISILLVAAPRQLLCYNIMNTPPLSGKPNTMRHPPFPVISVLAWGVAPRLAVAGATLLPVWGAVGWALGWWDR